MRRSLRSMTAAISLLLLSSHAWAADTADASEDQLTQDLTPVPAGMGSLLVPALTDPSDEPEVVVYHRGERIASGPTGQRIALPPGTYRVVLGAADPTTHDLPSTEVRILAGRTETAKPFYGALRVNVVDDDGQATAGEYVIVSATRGTVYGPVTMPVGTGSKPAPTWLLPPGKYLLVHGTNPRATEGSVAVQVGAGEATRYRLVVDDTHLLRTEFGDDPVQKTKSMWRVRWLLGASGTVSRRTGTFTGIQGDALFVNAFTRFEGGLNTKMHDASLRLNVDQSFIGVDAASGESVPVRALTNDVEGELLYNLRLGGVVGPYARALARTSLLKTQYRPEVDVVGNVVDEGNRFVRTEAIGARTSFTMFDSLAPFTIQEGVGLGVSALDTRTFTLAARTGLAARQSFYGGGTYFIGRNGNTVDLGRLDDHKDLGAELTVIGGLRLGQIASWETRFDAFVSKDQMFDAGTRMLPVFRWDNTVAFRFNQVVSAIYTLSLRRDELVVFALQSAQLLALRVQYSFF